MRRFSILVLSFLAASTFSHIQAFLNCNNTNEKDNVLIENDFLLKKCKDGKVVVEGCIIKPYPILVAEYLSADQLSQLYAISMNKTLLVDHSDQVEDKEESITSFCAYINRWSQMSPDYFDFVKKSLNTLSQNAVISLPSICQVKKEGNGKIYAINDNTDWSECVDGKVEQKKCILHTDDTGVKCIKRSLAKQILEDEGIYSEYDNENEPLCESFTNLLHETNRAMSAKHLAPSCFDDSASDEIFQYLFGRYSAEKFDDTRKILSEHEYSADGALDLHPPYLNSVERKDIFTRDKALNENGPFERPRNHPGFGPKKIWKHRRPFETSEEDPEKIEQESEERKNYLPPFFPPVRGFSYKPKSSLEDDDLTYGPHHNHISDGHPRDSSSEIEPVEEESDKQNNFFKPRISKRLNYIKKKPRRPMNKRHVLKIGARKPKSGPFHPPQPFNHEDHQVANEAFEHIPKPARLEIPKDNSLEKGLENDEEIFTDDHAELFESYLEEEKIQGAIKEEEEDKKEVKPVKKFNGASEGDTGSGLSENVLQQQSGHPIPTETDEPTFNGFTPEGKVLEDAKESYSSGYEPNPEGSGVESEHQPQPIEGSGVGSDDQPTEGSGVESEHTEGNGEGTDPLGVPAASGTLPDGVDISPKFQNVKVEKRSLPSHLGRQKRAPKSHLGKP